MRFAICAIAAVLFAAPAAHAAALSDRADSTIGIAGAAGQVNAIFTNGGQLFFGGDFTSVGTNSGPATQFDATTGAWSGSGWATPADETKTPLVSSAVPDGGGGWYVAGFFERSVAGATSIPAHNLMHVTSAGGVDAVFDPQLNGAEVYALAYDQGTNTLYVAGSFTAAGGGTQHDLAALDGTNGGERPGFDAQFTGTNVTALAISGGDLFAGGTFTNLGGQARTNLAKLDKATGTADATWNPAPDGAVKSLAASGADLYVAGDFANIGGSAVVPRLARLGTGGAGAAVTAFNPAPDAGPEAVVTDGTTVWLGGTFTTVDGAAHANLAAVAAASGTADAAFPAANGLVRALALQGPFLYAGGDFTFLGASLHNGVGRITTATGAVDNSISSATGPGVYTVAATASNFYVGGNFATIDPATRVNIVELDLNDGTAKPFSHSFNGPVRAMVGNSGVLYVGGDFTLIDGATTRDHAAAFDMATGALLPWNPAPNGNVLAMSLGVNQTVLIGGQFTVPQAHAAAIGQVGHLTLPGQDTGWAPAVNGDVNAVLLHAGTYYLGGSFTQAGGATRNNLAALSPLSAIADTNWNPDANGIVRALASTPAGFTPETVYAGGDFTTFKAGAIPRNRIASIPSAGGAANGTPTGWDPNADNTVRAISRAQSGLVYAGGDFSAIGGQPRLAVGAVDGTTGLANAWAPNLNVRTRALVSAFFDERLIAAGDFNSGQRAHRAGIAIWSEPPLPQGAVAITDPVAGQDAQCDYPLFDGSFPQTYSWAWLLDGVPIPLSSATQWPVDDSMVGRQLACRTFVNNLGYASSYDSPSKTVAARPQAGGGGPPPDPTPPDPTPPAPVVITAAVPADDIDGQPTPPPAVPGKSIVAEPTTGTVLIQLPGRANFIRLPDAELIPLKSVIDARKGSVRLTAAGRGGSAVFSEGVFRVTQGTGAAPLTTLTLAGGSFKACPKASTQRARRAAKRKLKKTASVRHLWGDGTGQFRTAGRYATATLRGTRWLTDDRCDGTLVRVRKGAVNVRDLPKRKTLVLKAPKSYVARP